MKAAGFGQSKNDKIANMLELKVRELSTYMKNKKILRVQGSTFLSEKEGQACEIECFTVLKHGSSQLGRQTKCCLDEGSTEK